MERGSYKRQVSSYKIFLAWRGLWLLLPVLLGSCSLQKDVDLELPPFQSDLVAECYLEPGKPYRLTVFQSTSFFDRVEPILATNVVVTITYKGQVETLPFNPTLDPETGKLFTHTSPKIVTGQPGEEYFLRIKDTRGREITGSTTLLQPVPIDTIEWKFNERNNAYLLVKFRDDPGTNNFYRFMIHEGRLRGSPDVNFTTTDMVSDKDQIVLGTTFRYQDQDTVFVTLFHLEEAHFHFINSVRDAENANGNPFAQPARIRSSLTGGIGIFTNLAYDRKRLIITR
ncbi:hypothetical protein BH24BAC1_BH24BAC1_08240 [soil metagenome]